MLVLFASQQAASATAAAGCRTPRRLRRKFHSRISIRFPLPCEIMNTGRSTWGDEDERGEKARHPVPDIGREFNAGHWLLWTFVFVLAMFLPTCWQEVFRSSGPMARPKKSVAQSTTMELKNAIEQYRSQYDYFPLATSA